LFAELHNVSGWNIEAIFFPDLNQNQTDVAGKDSCTESFMYKAQSKITDD
jgi:hypothetical protein